MRRAEQMIMSEREYATANGADLRPALTEAGEDYAQLHPRKAITSGGETRSYMPGVGLFLSRVGFEQQTEGEHPYGYAMNNQLRYTDPNGTVPKLSGASDYMSVTTPCSVNPTYICGANLDGWIMGEINAQVTAARSFMESFGTSTALIDSRALIGCHGTPPPLFNYAGWANMNQGYKNMPGLSNAPGCQVGPGCQPTVSLCGTCISRDQLGNIIYGIVAGAVGLSLTGVTYVIDCLKSLKRNPICEEKHAAYRVGHIIGSPPLPTTLGQFCLQLVLALQTYPRALDDCTGGDSTGANHMFCQICNTGPAAPASGISKPGGECWTPAGGPNC